jgi:O-methyltransferase involved in polyketide biosynthesis
VATNKDNISVSAVDTNKDNIPVSALYTSATWYWGRLPCADLVIPAGAKVLFRIVNAYMVLYRWLNPEKFSLQHMLLHRHTAINRLLTQAKCEQVIEIAAGFSPRGSMASANPVLNYFEIDLPDVVALKNKQLLSSSAGSAVLARDNFKLLPGDVTQLDFEEFPPRRSFVITEGLMMYFNRAAQLQIWKRIADFIASNGGEYVFDYIPIDDEPPRSRLGTALSRLRDRLFAKQLREKGPTFAYDERTRMQVADDLRSAGFQQVDVYSSAEIAREWSLPHSNVKTRVIIYRCR